MTATFDLPANLLTGALDDSGVAVITIESNGSMLSVNRATTAMFGYATDDLIGHNVSMLMPAHHRSRHDHYLERYLATGVAGIIGKTRKTSARRACGTVFPIHLAVGEHIEGNSVHFVGIIHDISEYEHHLIEATRFGRIVDESLGEIYVFAQRTLTFTMANRVAVENLGFSFAALQGMTPVDLQPGVSREQFVALMAPLLSGARRRIEYSSTFRRANGTSYDTDVVLSLSDAVSPPEVVAIVEDVTERRQWQKMLQRSQRMESIGELSGGIAHDFNNLLGIVSGNLEMLQADLQGSPQQEYVDDAIGAVQIGARLTQRLMSFAQRGSLAPQRIDLNDLLFELIEMLRHTLGSGITLHTILSSELFAVRVDRSQLENTVLNLAINARDAMNGQGVLTIETHNVAIDADTSESLGLGSGHYVSVQMSDTGVGIDASLHERIFEPFYTSKAATGGNGLGLSIIYGFVKQSGGFVEVASKPGHGARFTVMLPACAAPDDTGGDSIGGNDYRSRSTSRTKV